MLDPTLSLESKITQARTCRGIPPTEYQVPYRNIGDLVTKQAGKNADKTWLIYYPDPDEVRRTLQVRRTYTYSEFYELVCMTANFLWSQGIAKGDRIATVSFNHADTVVQYFAAWLVGAVVVPINIGEDDKRIGYILQNSKCRLAFVREQFIERIEKILVDTPSIDTVIRVASSPENPTITLRYPEFGSSIRNQKSAIRNIPQVSLEDEALIVYTSGTTGMPKGVVLTQYNLLVDAKAISEWHGMTPDQRMMCVLPIHHVNGTVVTLVTPMYYGGSVVLNQKFHSAKFFERAAADNVQVVSVVPTLLQFLLAENIDRSTLDLSKIRHIICGAGPLTCELATRFEDHFDIPIVHGYGLSETTCYSCFLPLDLSREEHRRWMREYGFPSIGTPIPPNEMAICDENGNELGQGVRGEIVIRGHNVMKEYYANPEVNEKTFAYGWFRSGDEGFYEYDTQIRKFFFITGRIKELIIRGGTNISPFEIDEVLMNMPGVKAGLAVGFENDWYGEEVGAYIQIHPGVHLTDQDILDHCKKYFSFQKSPKVVVFGNNIPVTSTGKYQRNKLKPLFDKWKTVQFSESKKGGC